MNINDQPNPEDTKEKAFKNLSILSQGKNQIRVEIIKDIKLWDLSEEEKRAWNKKSSFFNCFDRQNFFSNKVKATVTPGCTRYKPNFS